MIECFSVFSNRIPRNTEHDEILDNDSFTDLMSYVSTENFKNYLLQASKKYSTSNSLFGESEPDWVSEEVCRGLLCGVGERE